MSALKESAALAGACELVGNAQKQFLVMLNLFVELFALFAHGNPFERGAIPN